MYIYAHARRRNNCARTIRLRAVMGSSRIDNIAQRRTELLEMGFFTISFFRYFSC